MRYLVRYATGVLAVAGFAGVASAQCEIRYSSRLAEAALTARADIKARAIQSVADRLEAGLGERTSATVGLDARYTIFAAGGMAQEAYSETVDGFLCEVARRYRDDPEKLEKIQSAYRDIVLTLDEYFDPGLWQLDQMAARSALRERLRTAAAEAPLFPAEVASALPNPNFDLVKLREVTANVTIPQVVQGSICAGVVQRSIRRVEPGLLASLGRIRPMLAKWLSGDRASARLDLWLFASQQMTSQLTRAAAPAEQVATTPAMLACVRQASEAASVEQTTAPSPPSQTEQQTQPQAQPGTGQSNPPASGPGSTSQ